ncbi:hypothetical protein CGI03_09470 [Vibrio parahaemolyticus]|uniref:TIR domain-containing protein n=8 Tax=Vibrio parahaemolyticus TaxID=670 RepID=UPI0006A62B66|nr:TIR domain-containing protein [Vibrio parahaemolyticus]EJG1641866.1 TIR domain-containing protein [Vibrio parahaemolyticus]ELA8139734.1 TIR domain-containing protein [Vibrio parahaemolyticus]ELA9310192.1 TIR domain-containing protein [Vibrio parahaemolyticus]KOE92039.1 hypothetical protein ACS91_05200 [Vibrio parahaemolyticus]TOL20564.1 hypothetical protein CGI03_09470 [Vibrio parahaemolyticus]
MRPNKQEKAAKANKYMLGVKMKKVFISYSWDSEEHMLWVEKLANSLEEIEGIHVIWDGYDLDSCVDKNLFMEKAVVDADFTIVVATKKYREKADNREGGAGIETFLNVAKHWKEMLDNKRTSSVVALREVGSTPNYLGGHFHIDFTKDDEFSQSLSQLINQIESKPRVERPKKKFTATDKKKVYKLTKAADIIGSSARNRKPIITESEGTDFSGKNRIKFELWETKTPTVNHVLALHNNILIGQTLERAAELINEKNISITTLTVLRPNEKSKQSRSIDDILKEKYPSKYDNLNVIDITYKDYIWDYCIDEEFKTKNPPDIIDFYTNQEMVDGDKTNSSAVDFLYENVTSTPDSSAKLIIGSGGIGKTSLCLSLVNKLIRNKSEQFLTIFIQAEDIRKYLEENKINSYKIDSIFDVYELQAKYLNHKYLFDKKTLELSIACGNIIIVIDGLDELSSIFRNNFDIESFLTSIKNLHNELGTSRVILTSRDDTIITTSMLERLTIDKYELLGFKDTNCKSYLNRRFRAYDNKEEMVSSIMNQVEGSSLIGENRIVPFFIDVIATVYEENIEESEGAEINISSNMVPYPSLNELTDHLVFAIFEREKTRQKFHLEPKEMVELFCSINAELGDNWKVSKVKEVLRIYYDQNADGLFKCIVKNPILKMKADKVEFKYDFLHSYFNSLYLFSNYNNRIPDSTFIKILSNISPKSSEFKDLKRYFTNNSNEFILVSKSLVDHLKKKAVSEQEGSDLTKLGERERSRAAIENIILLLCNICGFKKANFSNNVKSLYGVGDSGTIEGLFIKGDLPPFDFSGLTVFKSKFRHYSKFLQSNFEKSKFIYCEFDGCHNDSYQKTSLLEAELDKDTCVINDLSETYSMLSNRSEENERLLLNDAEKFLRSFYRGSSFRDNHKDFIKFSNSFNGLKRQNFNKLLTNKYIVICKEKEVATFYEIHNDFKPHVRRFLNDGYKTKEIKEFFSFISS